MSVSSGAPRGGRPGGGGAPGGARRGGPERRGHPGDRRGGIEGYRRGASAAGAGRHAFREGMIPAPGPTAIPQRGTLTPVPLRSLTPVRLQPLAPVPVRDLTTGPAGRPGGLPFFLFPRPSFFFFRVEVSELPPPRTPRPPPRANLMREQPPRGPGTPRVHNSCIYMETIIAEVFGGTC